VVEWQPHDEWSWVELPLGFPTGRVTGFVRRLKNLKSFGNLNLLVPGLRKGLGNSEKVMDFLALGGVQTLGFK
jgi:hypothetical protein